MHKKVKSQSPIQSGTKVKSIDQIVSRTKADLEKRKRHLSLEKLKEFVGKEQVRPFTKMIQHPQKGSVAIIAEIKLASLSDQYLLSLIHI